MKWLKIIFVVADFVFHTLLMMQSQTHFLQEDI